MSHMRIRTYGIRIGGLILALLIFAASGSAVLADTAVKTGETASPEEVLVMEAGLQKLLSNQKMVLYGDAKTGAVSLYDRDTKTFWQTNPNDENLTADQALTAGQRKQLSSQISIAYLDEQSTSYELISKSGSVDKRGLTLSKTAESVTFAYRFPAAGITVPLTYRLGKDYLEVSVETAKVKEENEAYTLTGITVLPFMGCGNTVEKGYFMVPDGSGAVIEFNNGKGNKIAYSQRIYGRDSSAAAERAPTATETARMPVLGIHKENGGLLCVVEQGAPMASVNAAVAGMKLGYNAGYFSFDFRACENLRLDSIKSEGENNGVNDTDRSKKVVAHTEYPADTKAFTVRYYPLTEDTDYSGMALRYRRYLIEEKGLVKQDPAEALPFYASVYGAVVKKGSFLWMPVDTVVPLTTYNQAGEIAQALQQEKIKNIQLIYKAWSAGGLTGKLPTAGKYESKLGGKKAFLNLCNTLKQTGVSFVPDANILHMYKNGNGFRTSAHSATTVNRAPSIQYAYDLVSGYRSATAPTWYLLSPLHFSDAIEKFRKSYEWNGVISLSGYGSELYADYRKGETDRISMEKHYITAAAEDKSRGGGIVTDGGNAFLLPYLSGLVELPTEHSGFDIENYAVPFYQMVISGYLPYASDAFNLSADMKKHFLKAIETGSAPYYIFTAQNASETNNTLLNGLYNSHYTDWLTEAGEQYAKSNALYQKTKGASICKHSYLQQGAAMVTYDNGVRVVVNYTDKVFQTEFGSVPAQDFAVFEAAVN